ncbi:MAG: hypothetical protein IT201_03910 [Thermoleophilia bacterium]|nr:hypothetical protein [Thermoleophilia bacterium]
MPDLRLRTTIAAAAVAASLVAPAALAESASDPDDVPGRLDLKRLTLGGGDQLVTVRVVTWEKVRASDLRSAGTGNRLFVYFDYREDGAWDLRARIVELSEGKLYALLAGSGSAYEPLRVRRSGTSLTFAFPADVVGGDIETLQAWAKSAYRGSGCPVVCVDRAPDAGVVTT